MAVLSKKICIHFCLLKGRRSSAIFFGRRAPTHSYVERYEKKNFCGKLSSNFSSAAKLEKAAFWRKNVGLVHMINYFPPFFCVPNYIFNRYKVSDSHHRSQEKRQQRLENYLSQREIHEYLRYSMPPDRLALACRCSFSSSIAKDHLSAEFIQLNYCAVRFIK